MAQLHRVTRDTPCGETSAQSTVSRLSPSASHSRYDYDVNVCIVGGCGAWVSSNSRHPLFLESCEQVASRLTKLLRIGTVQSPRSSHSEDIATPILLSLEDAPVTDFTNLFENTKADIVYFSAGSGGKGGEERTKKVDFEGAVKIFDAIEGVNATKKPFLVLVSGVDIRSPDIIPAHYVSSTRL